jgi:HEPN domain-containing protein
MLTSNDLKGLSRARLRDAEALLAAGRFDGATYLCGYAVEIALKARIVKTLKWIGFPESRTDFNDLASFKTHNLQILLHLSGWKHRIRPKYPIE